jgi:LysW-gamma-L-lysine carboxypeptidase
MRLKVAKDHFHSAGEGSTAAEDLVAMWSSLKADAEAYNTGLKGIFDALQISLQTISSQTNGLSQLAEATIGYRLPPALAPEHLKSHLAKVLQAELEFVGEEIAYRSEKDTLLTRAFRRAIREQGGQPRFKVKTGTSDMNVIAPFWNVPMLAYGPGDSSLDHTPHEHLDLAEYEKAIAVLTTAFANLAKSV